MAKYATANTLEGTWDFRFIGIEGTFAWTLTDRIILRDTEKKPANPN